MAKIPTPRSYTQILGSMISSFVAKTKVKGLKVGGPILRILEIAAQSDTRATQETFSLLAASSLESAEGAALERHARDEGTYRLGATYTTGVVTIGDSRFNKTAANLYPGSAAPIVGSSVLYLTSNTGFPLNGGQIYIGRGTTNYEGPLTYTNITGNSAPFTLTLAAGSYTKKFHNVYESVVLAQGGNRSVPAGTQVQTPQGNSSDAISFSTLYAQTILDGEVEVENIKVVCNKPGAQRVIAGAVNSFVAEPFPGATVTNPVPFTNGKDAETESELKDRIRRLKQSRARGTDLALQQAVLGVAAQDENKQVLSASVVSRLGYPTTVFLDDGTGYEESSVGVALESLTDSASGGEIDFSIASVRPIAKAQVKATLPAPYSISPGMQLTVYVGGVVSRHSFSSDQFANITNASGYDVAAAINANPSLLFGARTADSGKYVILFAKSDVGESIRVAESDEDANAVFAFPLTEIQTLRLYKNDILLNKDGSQAILYSNPRYKWRPMQGSKTLTIAVDGTAAQTYTFTDADFVTAKTGHTTLSANNKLDAWVKVINAKIPGITASTDQNGLILTSNAGASSRASISITGGTLTQAGMFAVTPAVVGTDKDYTVNRHTGQIRLTAPLAAGDKLTAGTYYTRAFLESTAITSPLNLAAGTMWIFVDSDPAIVPTDVTGASTITISNASGVVTLSVTNGSFANVQPGDWVILWDGNFNAANKGAWRVARLSSGSIVFGSSAVVNQSNLTLASAGLTVVRAIGVVQEIPIAANASYTANSLATQINAKLKGAVASVSRTSRLRITTNTYSSSGSVMVAALNTPVPVTVGELAISNTAQVGVVTSAAVGTPTFSVTQVSATTTTRSPSIGTLKYSLGDQIVGLRRLPAGGVTSYGTSKGFVSTIESASGATLTLRESPLREWSGSDRIFASSALAIGPQDTLNVVLDQDEIAKTFAPAMFRKCSTVGAYGTTISLKDADNANASLASAWGVSPGFNFADFAVYMKPRTQSNLSDSTKTALWRYNRFGYDGANATMRYEYPLAASQAVAVAVDPYSTRNPDIAVTLASGAARNLSGIRATTHIGAFCTGRTGNAPYTHYLFTGLRIAKLSRIADGTVTVTVVYPDAAMNLNPNPLGFAVGDYVYVSPSSTGTSFDGTAGYRQITAVSTGAAPYTFAYNDGLSTVETTGDGSTSNIGTVSFDTAVATFAGVSANDVVSFSLAAGVSSAIENTPLRIVSVDPNSLWVKVVSQVGPASTTINWGAALGGTSYVSAYPIVSNTVAQIVTAVNSLSGPISGVATGTGAGAITQATWDERSDVTYKYSFADGVNFVKASTAPGTIAGNYTFDLKLTANANLASGNNDWANEEVRLTPITPATVSAYLNSPAVSGLFANADIRVAVQNGKLQISTGTVGSEGAVAVLGGTANSALAAIVGGVGTTGDGLASYVYARTPEVAGIYAGAFVEITNTLPHSKPISVNLSSIAIANGLATFTFASAIRTSSTLASNTWQFEKHGNYMAVVWDSNGAAPSLGAFVAGDYVTFSGATLSAANTGSFQIAAIDATAKIVWVYNPNCVEEIVAATVELATSGSVMVGDNLVIGSETWGATNLGSYTIVAVTDTSFSVPAEGISAVAGPVAPSSLNQITSGTLSTLVKKVRSIVPGSVGLMTIVFEDKDNYTLISPSYGTVLKALDKLAFSTNVFVGADGYSHSVGLLAEATKVLYGDPRDPDTYPGYVAAGSNIGVSGPVVRRLNLSLAVRLRGGTPPASIFSAVKSAVASVVNTSKLGQPIPISDIVNAASNVNGVLAVTILSPSYGNGNDIVSVQPHEKAMILNVDSDIQVTIAGS